MKCKNDNLNLVCAILIFILVHNAYGLRSNFSAMNNMTAYKPEKIDKEYLEDLLKTLDLKERENHLPSELSGGQQQRTSIGRALINRPSIVLADEPTGNLDSKNSKEIIELLKVSVKKYNQTLIMITHDTNIALQADRVITIEDGIIKSDEVI